MRSTYYKGDLEEDLKRIENEPHLKPLQCIGHEVGYGHAQEMIVSLRKGEIPLGSSRRIDMLQHALQGETHIAPEKILQILWAQSLRDANLPTDGALLITLDN